MLTLDLIRFTRMTMRGGLILCMLTTSRSRNQISKPCEFTAKIGEPEVFRPERFDPEEVLKRNSIAWLPFGDGPRNCIGMRFGKMQSYVGLVSLLKDYKFSVSKKNRYTYGI